MKTKNLILMFALLLSGIVVSAQSFSKDDGKMKIRHDQTSKPHIEISKDPSSQPDYVTSFGTWWQLLKMYVVPGIGIGNDEGANTKSLRIQKKDRRTLPRLPGPHRYFETDAGGNNAGN